MQTVNTQIRQSLRCAYEPRIEGSRAWEPCGYAGPALETCPSYTTRLPEVIEVAEARYYLQNGSLSLLVRDELTDGLREGIAILEAAEGEVLNWITANPEKK